MSFGRDDIVQKASDEGFEAIVDTMERCAQYIEDNVEFNAKQLFNEVREDADLPEFDDGGYDAMMETVNKLWNNEDEPFEQLTTTEGYRVGIFVVVNEIDAKESTLQGMMMSYSEFIWESAEEMVEERSVIA
mgnify:CR=1 FL=1